MTDILTLHKFEALSPFEIKDELIKLAKKASQTSQSAFLNAGRGNPNWVATEPREAFFLLGQFAITESKRVMAHPAGLGGMPQAKGIASRLEAWLAKHSDMCGASVLSAMIPFAVKKFGFEPDAFVHELVDSIIGDNYPVPDRMLVHNERIAQEYLMWAMCGEPRPAGTFDLYAVEGGTAAMCYIFKSLKANRLLHPGDTIALGTPIFTPYLEMTRLEDYDLKVVHIKAPQENRFQYTDSEIKKLEDPRIKAFFVVNPGNPTGLAMSKETIGKIANLVRSKRPDLMLLTDDVYGTFVDDFRSLLGELPQNTIGVYSYSKYFGATGWRLGAIAVHQDNIFDKMITRLPADAVDALDKRYGPLTLEPRKLKFIDRIVADSRDVALNHTAGLSLPQQVMMSLFSLREMMDTAKSYRAACKEIVHRRVWSLINSLGLSLTPNPDYDGYYGLVDFEFWARIGYSWGQGVLHYKGMNYPFTVNGLSIANVGGSSIHASGDVYDLTKVEDFPGNFTAVTAGMTIAGGASGTAMQNQNGVVMQISSTTQGLQFTLAPSGIAIALEGSPTPMAGSSSPSR